MIYSTVLSREDFLAWLGGKLDLSPRVNDGLPGSALSQHQVALMWDRPVTSIPMRKPLIGVPKNGIPEFFAFSSTYISTYSPFSAFFRIGDVAILSDLLTRNHPEKVPPQTIVGVAIAEAFAHMSAQRDARIRSINDIPIQACLATMASSVISGLMRGDSHDNIMRIAKSWSRGRQLLADDPLNISYDVMEEFWELVSLAWSTPSSHVRQLDQSEKRITDFLRILLHEKRINNEIWNEVATGIQDFRDVPSRMRGTREERVRIFDDLVHALIKSTDIDRRIKVFIGGTLMALVSDGSFEYLSLGQTVDALFPQATLWFGLIASLADNTDALSVGSCLGRRVAREVSVVDDISGIPNADISIDELSIFDYKANSVSRFRTEYQSIVKVEIFPGICARYRSIRDNSKEYTEKAYSVSSSQVYELRRLMKNLEGVIDSFSPGTQANLFSEPPPKKKPYQRKRLDEK